MKHPLWKQRSIFISLLMLPFVTISCVNDDYDLEKDINTEINVGGSLEMPLGTTSFIRLDKILDLDDEFVSELADGTLVIQKSDQIEQTISIDPISLMISDLAFDDLVIDLGPGIPSGVIPGITADVEVKVPFDATSSTSYIDEAAHNLKSIRSVSFANAVTAQLSVNLSWNSLPDVVESIRLKNVELSLPDFLQSPEAQNGKINFPLITLQRGDKLQKNITLTGVKFDANNNPIHAGRFQVAAIGFEVKGELEFAIQAGSIGVLSTVTLSAAMDVPTLSLGEVTGEFVAEIDPIGEQIELDEIPEEFTGAGSVFSLLNPEIKLSISNTLPLPINIDQLTLTGTTSSGKKTQVNLPQGTGIHIAQANAQGAVLTDYHLSATGAGAGDRHSIVIPQLPDLLKEIPKTVAIEFAPALDQTQSYTFDLSPDPLHPTAALTYPLQATYELYVPLTLGNDFRLRFEEILDDLQKDIKDFSDKVDYLEVELTLTNTLPLDMEVTAQPYRANGVLLPTIEISVEGAIAAGGERDGSVLSQESQVKVTLKELQKGAFEELDQLGFVFTAKSNSAQVTPLKSSQGIQIKAKLKVPNGLHFTL